MHTSALGEGDALQALNEAEVLGVLAEQDQASMVGGQIEGWAIVRAHQPWRGIACT